MKILLTTTSFQDTPGAHHDVLKASGFEVVTARGPLNEQQMLDLIKANNGFDGLLNGDDKITAKVIDAALPRLRVIAKYGIGLDSIDVKYATSKKLPVLFTPGVNETTVAEHAFGLMIAVAKNFKFHLKSTNAGGWKRETGHELFGKTLGIFGLGRIGKEVVKRAGAFGMTCIGHGHHWDDDFARQHNLTRLSEREAVLKQADILSLHTNLTPETRGFINKERIAMMKDGAMLINTARGGLIVEEDVAEACKSKKLFGYGTDVLAIEPMKSPHIFQEIDNIIVTPHVGSRTFESVQRQGLRAVNNLVNFLTGKPDFIQANSW
ncbi:MAG TPA: phosphoglycerate dehydrogenase [Tepidisphaeraceae bacterium]|jgi:D-3-phosphoglycerate dehydrogenase|nr:phosphoglycerate dehydrogenase [Tepidisphaeraceae bacterium]